jgi:L-2,4-diaminobutyrate decarboxylase
MTVLDGAIPAQPRGTAAADLEGQLAGTASGRAHLERLLGGTLRGLAAGAIGRGGPLPVGGAPAVAATAAGALGAALPEDGTGDVDALASLVPLLASGSADPADPACAGHLHCPPLAVAVAADAAVSVLNPSLDSWDQAPMASAVEEHVIAGLARLVGYDPRRARGVFTTGGTGSNLMGLLFARTRAGQAAGHQLSLTGLPALGDTGWRPVVFCSEIAHFSIQRGAALLGLGEDCVVGVAVDDESRMIPAALAAAIDDEVREGRVPIAVVATAGSTDLGSIDPLPAVVDVVRQASRTAGPERPPLWLHVDAAYGGGALFSDRLAGLLDGIAEADSVSLDLHKYGWQPAAAGVFLTRERSAWQALDREVAYLNAADDTEAGFPDLLGRSLRTTRRPDAFKVAVTLRALGRRGLGELVDRCHALAGHAADLVRAHPRLELAAEPTLSTVVFRYLPDDPTVANTVNADIRRRLLNDGTAVVGRADLGPEQVVHLKLTLLNPAAKPADVAALLGLVVAAGEAEEV